MKVEAEKNWAAQEFSNAEFGDRRLKLRLISLSDRVSDAPENPINQKWAYFRNYSHIELTCCLEQ